jgi:hypothetical protein
MVAWNQDANNTVINRDDGAATADNPNHRRRQEAGAAAYPEHDRARAPIPRAELSPGA